MSTCKPYITFPQPLSCLKQPHSLSSQLMEACFPTSCRTSSMRDKIFKLRMQPQSTFFQTTQHKLTVCSGQWTQIVSTKTKKHKKLIRKLSFINFIVLNHKVTYSQASSPTCRTSSSRYVYTASKHHQAALLHSKVYLARASSPRSFHTL